MLDKLGKPLEVGDIVIMPHRNGYVDLQVGRVVGFTPQNVRVEIYDAKRTWGGHKRMINPGALAVIHGEDAMAYVLQHG